MNFLQSNFEEDKSNDVYNNFSYDFEDEEFERVIQSVDAKFILDKYAYNSSIYLLD